MRTIALSIAALLATAGLAHAQGSTTIVEGSPDVVRVPYEAASLRDQSGVRDLRNRVRGAARRVCDLGEGSDTIAYRERVCFQATLPPAFAQIDRAVELAQRGALASAPRIVVAAR